MLRGILAIMNELIAYIAGLFTKAIAAYLVGKLMGRPLAWVVAELQEWPRLLHYLRNHQGRSIGCHDCVLGTPTKVDSLSD